MKRTIGMAALAAVISARLLAGEADLGAAVVGTDNNDHFDNGVGFCAFIGVRPVPAISIRGTLLAWDADVQSEVLSRGTCTAVGIEGSLLLNLDIQPAIHLWAGGGIGAYGFERYDEDWGEPYGRDWQGRNDIEDEVGYHVLAGGDVIIAGAVSMFVEAKRIFLDATATTGVAERPPTGPGGGSADFTETVREINLDTTFVAVGIRVRL